MTRQGWWPPRLCWRGPLGLVLPACWSGLLFLVVYKKLIEFSVLLFNLTSSFFYRPRLISSFICFPFLFFLCIYMLIKSAWIIYIIKTSQYYLCYWIFFFFLEFLLLILMKAHWFLESWRGTQKWRAFPLQSLLANDKPLVKDLEARALLPVEAAPSSLSCSTKGTKVAPKSLSDLLPLIRLLKSFYEELICFCHRFVHVIKPPKRP
ncbi:hypothetical protein NC651_033770 [Populus alba x Populus x berolinensis]|nr:hypothetical protein NC651_033770 [Populus alba x Populus x berolinensis]